MRLRDMQHVTVKGRKYYLPFIDLIEFDAKQLAFLNDEITKAGKIVQPIVCWKEKHTDDYDVVVDGIHRVMQASELDIRVPVRLESYETDDDARNACISLNAGRRHMTAAQRAAAKASRVERIAKKRSEGKSLRTIAQEEGVSHTQVAEDLQEAGVKGFTPEGPEVVVGQDGNTYAASKRKTGGHGSKTRNGRQLPELQEIKTAIGVIKRKIDVVAIYYGMKDSRGAVTGDLGYQGIDRQLETLLESVSEWYKGLKKGDKA